MKELSSADPNEVYAVYKVAKQIAGGQKPYLSPQVRKKDIDKVESDRDDWRSKAKEKYKNAGSQAMVSYTCAAVRDLNYATAGRKYMRVLALTGATTSAAGRGYLIGLAQAAAGK